MIHVLIIEDEPAIARGLSLLITKNYPDFQISGICKNGRDGLQKILELKPELVFTDITMPVMNGLEATKLIRQFDKNIPIVAVTANVLDFDRKTALANGCNEFVTKPVVRNQLIAVVETYKRK